MILLVGLGNPGEKYARTRHNIGFMAMDEIGDAAAFGPERSKFQGLAREGRLGREKALILKPQTFMNESGRSVAEAAKFFKVSPDNIIVFHDELDLVPGKLRMKRGGGHAGHNGLRSIHAHLGADYRRARLGIGHPGDKSKVSGYVLHDFAKADQDWLAPMLTALARHAALIADDEDARFQTAVAQDLSDGQKPPKRQEPSHLQNGPKSNDEDAAAPSPFDALKRLIRRP